MAQPVSLAFRIAANLTEFRANLAEAQTQLETTKKAMQQMANGFDGSRVISDANAIVKVVTDLGSASRLTEGEQRRVNAVLTEAIEKYNALGREAPERMVRLANATQGAVKPTDDLHHSFQKFDSILATLGINLGAEVKGLGEVAAASGKTAGELGTLATVGLAAAAAVGGWKIGRWISDLGGFDEKIGDITAKLLGWGDVAAERAAAGTDVLAKASKLAGMQITDMELAMALLSGAAEAHAKAVDTSAARIAGWRQEIEKVKNDGTWVQLTDDIKSQNFSLEELGKRYGITVDAIQYYTREQQKSDAAIEDNNKRKLAALEHEAQARKEQADLEARTLEQVTRLWDEYNTERVAHGGTATEVLRAQTDQWANDLTAKAKRAGTDTEAFYTALAATAHEKMESIRLDWGQYNDYSQAKLQETADRERALYEEMLLHASEFSRGAIAHQRKVAEDARDAATAWGNPWNAEMDKVGNKAESTAEQMKKAFDKAVDQIIEDQNRMTKPMERTYDLSTDEGRAEFMKLNPMAQITAPKEYFTNHTIQDALRDGFINFYAGYNSQALRGFAGGVSNADPGWAVVGERGPELMYVPKGADIYPNGTAPGAGVVIQNLTVQVTQPLGTPAALAEAVTSALTYKFRSMGLPLPVGV